MNTHLPRSTKRICKRQFYLDVELAMDALTPKQREVFEQVQDGESKVAIAGRFGTTRRAIERVYEEARYVLREHLDGYQGIA